MAVLTPYTGTFDVAEVQHLARRAGFGLSPEAAQAFLAAHPDPVAAAAAWVDGTAASQVERDLFQAVLADRADPVDEPARGSAPNLAPAVLGPHRYLVDGADAWRNSLSRGQAAWAFRMQHSPYPFAERMALFWHNLFATGHHKVDNVALMLGQVGTLRSLGLARFDDLHVAMSKDPAMAIWLDSVQNNAAGTNTPNENYAREALELYSLGADNGYNQQDITQLARALSGWSFTCTAAQLVVNPTSSNAQKYVAGGTFRVFDGSASSGEWIWNNPNAATAPTKLPTMHGKGTITFLGQDPPFDIDVAPAGMAKGEDVLRSIVTGPKGPNCAQFLARRLIDHFVASRPAGPDTAYEADVADVQGLIQSSGFELRVVMKALLASQYFHDAKHRWSVVEGPVSWTVRAARALGYDLAAADALAPKAFAAWAVVAPFFDQAGMKLLDPSGPNGWKEGEAWLNSNTIRYRTRLAAALALGETFSQRSPAQVLPLFPTDPAHWFAAAVPTTPLEVYTRVVALLQPAPIPTAVRDSWLAALWPAPFAWDATGQDKARELAFLVLCSPAGQLY
jgi:uncharacterized protein (DUF1800 family)